MISSTSYSSVSPFWSYTQANMPGSSSLYSTAPAQTPTFQPMPAMPYGMNSSTTALQSTYDSFNSLSQAANRLNSSSYGNVFDQRSVDTGNSANVTATAYDGATIASYSVGITQIATAQQNTGSNLQANGTGTFAAGTDTFSLTVGGKTTNLSVNVGSTDTNSTVLSNMASAINGANLGVTAQVVTTTDSNNVTHSQLVVNAASTGTNNAFSLSDQTGNLVSASGASSITRTAANADYTVNGTAYESQSNNVTLDNNNLSLTLNSTTTQNVNVNVTGNTDAINQAVTDFVNQYNSTLSALQNNSDVVDMGQYDQLTSLADTANLSGIGITVNSDNTLSLNTNDLQSALSSNFANVQSQLGGVGGFASNVAAQASSIAASPLTDLLNTTFDSSQILQSTLPSNYANYEVNMYQSSMNLQLLTGLTGNFLNTYF